MAFETIKYESTLVTFTEVPDEIALCFNISGCPCFCEGCFEPWLKDDIGIKLTAAVLEDEIASHPHITTVCFMGGDRYYEALTTLITEVQQRYPQLKWAMYSGRTDIPPSLKSLLDYYKVGPYIAKYGPLDNINTNQRMYRKKDGMWEDITFRFQKKKV